MTKKIIRQLLKQTQSDELPISYECWRLYFFFNTLFIGKQWIVRIEHQGIATQGELSVSSPMTAHLNNLNNLRDPIPRN